MIKCEEGGMNNNCKCCNNYNTYGEDFGFDIWSIEASDEDNSGEVGWDENAWWGFDLGGGENMNENKEDEDEDDFTRAGGDFFDGF